MFQSSVPTQQEPHLPMLDANRSLVIVPCGRSKIWDRHPEHGPTLAQDAYTGSLFRMNRLYAERFGRRWVILSAKYGFIAPTVVIPGPYDTTFLRASSSPITVPVLQQQVAALGLADHDAIIGLGGAAYRTVITEAFGPWPVTITFPFAGLPIGKLLHATKAALTAGNPYGA
jgi:hypothetical protein